MIAPVRFSPVLAQRPSTTTLALKSISRKFGSETVTFSSSKETAPGKAPIYRVGIRTSAGTAELRSDQPPKGQDPVKWAEGIRRLAEKGLHDPKLAAHFFGPVAADFADFKKGEIDQAEFAATFARLVSKS